MVFRAATQEIQSIVQQLIERYHPQKIILFGSAARGDPEVRDLDFVIIKRETPHYGADRIREVSRLIDRQCAVDFLVYRPEEWETRHRLGDPFILGILQEGKILYG